MRSVLGPRAPLFMVALIPLALACAGASEDSGKGTAAGDPPQDAVADTDGDGVPDAEDCAPSDPTIHPGAEEGCDLIDTDCDGELGEAELDADGDGYPACAECDDGRVGVHPGAVEVCDPDGIDEDCNGLADDLDPGVTGRSEYVLDADGDGYGPPSGAVEEWCIPPTGRVLDRTDCDDTDRTVHPAAAASEAELCTRDADGDGYGADSLSAPAEAGTDCDDTDASRHPGQSEETAPPLSDPACDGLQVGALDSADHTIYGQFLDGVVGGTVSMVGDLDGDGLPELALGGRGDRSYGADGVVYVFTGSSLQGASVAALHIADADHQLFLEDSVAPSISSAGDVDGDGLGDLLVGGSRVYLLRGSTLAGLPGGVFYLDEGDLVLTRERDGPPLEQVVAAGDLDGDGLDDILVGARQDDHAGGDSGKCHILFGSTLQRLTDASVSLDEDDITLLGEARDDRACSVLAAPGDVDGDGLADLFVSSMFSEDRGKAYFFSGRTLAAETRSFIDLSEADIQFVGAYEYGFLGSHIAAAGDVDGDGLQDLWMTEALGRPEAGQPSTGYLVLGSTVAAHSEPVFDPLNADLILEFPASMSCPRVFGVGDLDADGLPDVVASDACEGGGEVWILPIATAWAHPTSPIELDELAYRLSGSGAEALGTSVSTAGDVNGDGRDDLLLGAPWADDVQINAGKAYLLFSGL